jgi:hemerythrin superfamily protein
MATARGVPNDVVTFLKAQHRQVKSLLAEVLSSQGAQRERTFEALRVLFTAHESAEKEIVHPASRLALNDGEAIARERAQEELAASKALSELGTLDMASAAFEAKFRVLQAQVLAHAEAEESQEFVALRSTIDPRQLASMLREVEAAESTVPPPPTWGQQLNGPTS